MSPDGPVHCLWLSLLAGVLFLTGCDNTIEPFSEEGSYSVYGVLDPGKETQLIRVKPLSVPIQKVDSNSVNATVRLENVDAGTTEVLADSIIRFQDDESTVLTHNFWTTTPITHGTKYRITVEGEAGTVEATTVTPTSTDPDVLPDTGECSATYTAFFNEIEDPRRIRASFELMLEELPQRFRNGDWAFFPVDHISQTEDGRLAASFNPGSVLGELTTEVDFLPSPPPLPDSLSEMCWAPNTCWILGSDQVRLRYTYLGSEWYGDVPEDSLTYDPLESNDVSGGLGFFGSVQRDTESATTNTYPFVWTGGRKCTSEPPDSVST